MQEQSNISMAYTNDGGWERKFEFSLLISASIARVCIACFFFLFSFGGKKIDGFVSMHKVLSLFVVCCQQK